MKKVLLLMMMAVAGLAATYAQQHYQPVPFQLDNAIWYEYYVDAEAYEIKQSKGNWYHYEQFYFDSCDLYIDSKKYREIIIIENGVPIHTGLVFREDSAARKIYVGRGTGSNFKESLFYDFSVQAGDTVTRSFDENYDSEKKYIVDSIDTVSIGGVLRKRLHIHDDGHCVFTSYSSFHINETWIEGIGSSLGLFYPSLIWAPTNVFENVLVCYSSSGSVIYHDTNFTDCMPTNSITSPEATPPITAYPNPAKDRITFDFGGAQFETLQVINTAGVVVREARIGGQTQYSLPLKGLPAGVYLYRLQNGETATQGKLVVEN